jgi:intracellular sulfur oxidation DsrE/DsrF family protein
MITTIHTTVITIITDSAMRTSSLTLVMLAVFAGAAAGQASTGPIVNAGGPTFPVANPTFETPMDRQFKAVFELRAPAGSPDRMNQNLGTMARYLNMHARAGVPRENVRVAGVVHGGAAIELLQDEHYRSEHGVDNPNKELIAEIIAGGGQVILCGQTAGARGITADQLLPGVQLALSAMTAMTVLQQDGYQVILW